MQILSLKTLGLLAVISFFSCSKGSSDKADYYVKLKIDGNWITWKVVTGELGADLADASKTDFGITANNDAMKDVFDISIQVTGSIFNTGTYESDSPNYLALVSYAKDVGTGNSKYFDIEDAPTGAPSKYTINVNSITSTTLRGTFTGNYLLHSNSGEIMNLTEGEFFVQRIR